MDFIISIVIAFAIMAVFIIIMLKIVALILIKYGVFRAKEGVWEILQKILTDENAQAALKKWISTMFGHVSAAISGHKNK